MQGSTTSDRGLRGLPNQKKKKARRSLKNNRGGERWQPTSVKVWVGGGKKNKRKVPKGDMMEAGIIANL